MNDRQKTKGHKGQIKMWRISNKTVNFCGIQTSVEEAFEFCWSSWADQHNTLPKSTRRHAKLEKFIFGTPWLPDLLGKHWFASSVWNFCRWVAHVPPCETSPATKSKEKRMFPQASKTLDIVYSLILVRVDDINQGEGVRVNQKRCKWE